MSFLQTLAAAFKGGASARVPLARTFTSPWLFAEGSARAPFEYTGAVKRAYLDNPVAQRAVRLVAEGIGGAPLLPCDPRLAALVQATSAGQALLETLAAQLVLHGNAYVQVIKDGGGRPAELFALRPERVSIMAGEDGWPAAYAYRVGERSLTIPVLDEDASPNLIHIRHFHPGDDHYGAGCLAAADQTVAVHNAAADWNRALLENAARPSGALVYDPGDGAGLSAEQFERLKAELGAAYSGMANAGRPLLLEGGLKWQALSLSPADMDFAGLKAAAARDIALAFGVPPMLIGLPGDATYANYREANRALWRLTLLPLASKILSAIAEGLATWFPDQRLARRRHARHRAAPGSNWQAAPRPGPARPSGWHSDCLAGRQSPPDCHRMQPWRRRRKGRGGPPGLQAMLAPVIADCKADVPLDGLDGITVEGSPAELLDQINALFPLSCDACDTRLTIRPERGAGPPLALPEATSAHDSDSFGRQAGFVRARSLASEPAFSVLRHYDPDRDYQPGSQRAQGAAQKGQPRVLELPATIAASAALRLVNAAVKRQAWSRHALSWRISQIDPAIRPGSVVTVPHEPGQWRVRSWEWRNDGTELQLERVTPVWPGPAGASDPGRAASDADRIAGPTMLIAFELPWDGNPATPLPQVFVGAGSTGEAWSGASLYMDSGDGALQPIGSTGRVPAVVGTSLTAPPAGSPLLFDRGASLIVSLADPAANLTEASMRQLAQGANQALLGGEIIQFAWATPLGGGQWRLSGLLRGRAGTEAGIASHQPGEPFVLLDGGPTQLDLGAIDPGGPLRIAAIGLGDDAPVYSQVRLAGIGWRPLSPVHGTASALANGGLLLRWTRRTRGGLRWDDGLELPLNEQREAYIVEFGTEGSLRRWDCSAPWLELSPAEWSALHQAQPNGRFTVSQVGDRAVSPALTIDPA